MIKLYDHPSEMEPMMPKDDTGELMRLAVTLIRRASALSNALHPITRQAIVRLVEPMNSYYSNLIEGHHTHPLDIERALRSDYSAEPKKHLLQLESYAHIEVHREMKEKLAAEQDCNVYTAAFLQWIHERFYLKMPEELRRMRSKEGPYIDIVPGQIRVTEIEIGQHIGPLAKSLADFMKRFEEAYSPQYLADEVDQIVAAVASHHRLVWIHPFADGNGRVARLFTEACMIKQQLDGSGLWSISRGLAQHNRDYYKALQLADDKRRHENDGDGKLSNQALVQFSKFMIRVAIDQVDFMRQLLDVDHLLERIERFVDLMETRGRLRPESKYILQEVFLRGSVPRGDMGRISGRSDNTARKVMYDLLQKQLLVTEGPRMPVSINFPVAIAPYIFPNLYPGNIEATLFRL